MIETADLLTVIGCGGHARSIADVFLDNHLDVQMSLLFLDSNAREHESIYGYPALSVEFPASIQQVIIGIGDNTLRRKLAEKYKQWRYVNIIAQDAYIGHDARMGTGNFIAHHAHVGPSCVIGNHTIINTGASIDHESSVGSFSHLAPHVTVSGRSHIGDNVFMGAGSVVIDKVRIASHIVVGAGAVVVKDLTEPGTYVGVPARRIK